MNEELLLAVLLAVWKRVKSFLWRFLFALITYALAWFTNNLDLIGLHPIIASVIVLGLGELSKSWANFMDGKGKTYFGRAK